MSILSTPLPHGFGLLTQSMIRASDLQLSEVLNCSIIADAFEDDSIDFGKADEDVFTPAITLWAMVSQMLSSGTARSCKVAAGRVVSLIAQTTGRIVSQNAGNYCRAKAKIPTTTIRKITMRLAREAELASLAWDDPASPIEADQAEDRSTPAVVAEIRSVPVTGRMIMADGFTIDGPDTAENLAAYPQNPAQEEGLGFPILRCVCLISMFTGLLVDLGYAAYSGKGTGETTILRQLRSSLRPGDTLVADSYHCTYWLLAMCLKLGVHAVMKNHHKRDDNPIRAKRYRETERTAVWTRPQKASWISKKEYRQILEFIEIRLSDIKVVDAHTPCKGDTVATTLLDREVYPGAWLGSIYQGRPMVKPDIESIKCVMGLEHLRGQSPEALERKIWTGMLTYNLVRLKMLQSG